MGRPDTACSGRAGDLVIDSACRCEPFGENRRDGRYRFTRLREPPRQFGRARPAIVATGETPDLDSLCADDTLCTDLEKAPIDCLMMLPIQRNNLQRREEMVFRNEDVHMHLGI